MNGPSNPLVSILLPVYNAQEYLGDCIRSILSQTFHDFELLVMDDGSTDDSIGVAYAFGDERIRVVRCVHDFVNTLNRGIVESRGQYIARMDADDLMMPDRLERQVGIMEEKTSVAVCFSHVITYGDMEKRFGIGKGLVSHPLIEMLQFNIFIHPTAIIRRSFLLSEGIRYHHYPYAEDYKLWTDLCRKGGQCFVVDVPLIKYRMSDKQVSVIHREEQEQTTISIRQEILEHLLVTNSYKKDCLMRLYENLLAANEDGLLDCELIFHVFYQIFMAIKNKDNAGIFLQNKH